MGKAACQLIVSRLFGRLFFVILSLISLSSQTRIPFVLYYNRCDKSEMHVFGPLLFDLRVSWCGGPLLMMNIQEVDEQELCRKFFFIMLRA